MKDSTGQRPGIGHRAARACAAFAMAGAALAAAAAEAPPGPPSSVPVEAFFDPPFMARPVLSPDGDALAALVRNKAGRRQLVILDTADPTKVNVAAAFDNVDIAEVWWADDKRLIFSTRLEDESAWGQKGSALYAVDRTGSDVRELILPNFDAAALGTGTNLVSHTLSPDHFLLRTLRDGTSDVVILRGIRGPEGGGGEYWHTEFVGYTALRLDTRTGRATAIAATAPEHTTADWLIDEKGAVLGVMTSSAGSERLMVPDGAGWKEHASFRRYAEGSFSIEDVGPGGRVYATQATGGAAQTQGLFRLDLATGRLDKQPVVDIQGYDFGGSLIPDLASHRLAGVRYTSDAAGTAWFDPAMAALQKKIDTKLPNLDNLLDPAECGCSDHFLVTSFSDHQPPVYFIYDRAKDTLRQVGAERPRILPAQMADTDLVRIKARDGAEIPVYVTRPKGKGPWPAVVLVHGGPWLRGFRWEWNAEAQYLASRGYAVVAPEFRGSTGYGFTHFQAGWKQWGLAMQDDVADATTWAEKQGIADAARVCIAGGTYGGYATLMGLFRYPQLYRCGIATSAITDLALMYETWWSDESDESKGYDLPMLMGDKVKDAAQFEATSPLKQAAKITRPLLLAHGGVDRRVPVEHADRFRAALEANHAPLTWVFYSEEGHGWFKPQTKVDWYRRVAAFLDAQIGPGAGAATPSARTAASAPE